jgi:hypothetical protein
MSRPVDSRLHDAASEWRAATAPPDFASRVVGLALAAADFDDGAAARVHVRSVGELRLTENAPLRAWLRRGAMGLALALGAGAAAALGFANDGSRASGPAVEPEAAEPVAVEWPVTHAAQVSVATGLSERNVGVTKVTRPIDVTPVGNVATEGATLLPSHIHVPPCQCTLSAVLCSCVE